MYHKNLASASVLLLCRNPEDLETLPEALQHNALRLAPFAGPLSQRVEPAAGDLLIWGREAILAASEIVPPAYLQADVWLRWSQMYMEIGAEIMFRTLHQAPAEIHKAIYEAVLESQDCYIASPGTIVAGRADSWSMGLPEDADPTEPEVKVRTYWQLSAMIPNEDRELLRAIGAIQTVEKVEREEIVQCLPPEL